MFFNKPLILPHIYTTHETTKFRIYFSITLVRTSIVNLYFIAHDVVFYYNFIPLLKILMSFDVHVGYHAENKEE